MGSAAARLLGGLDYPMAIVTASGADGPAGCLVGFWTQCSIRPPRLLVCISKQNHTYRVVMSALWLGVVVPSPADHALAERFGAATEDRVDKFDGLAWHEGPHGVPLLDGAERFMAGPVLARMDLGDHEGLLVGVEAAEVRAAEGLLWYSEVRDISPGHPA